jgi:hypothetical protein
MNMEMFQLMKMADGNPGAAAFLVELVRAGFKGQAVIDKIKEYGIKGTDLYVLWSDICGRDERKVMQLVAKCPKDILVDACSRQDYSGRQLVANYLN